MIRLYIVLLHLIGVLFLKLLFSGDVSISMDIPGQINAGKDLKIQVTLKKGDLKGFSRFQMDLPAGVTASNIYSANADFSFKDQKVRLIWLQLPDDEDITVSFNIQCNEHLKGNFDLAGKFSYIENNERKTVDVQPKTLAIVPSPGIDPNLLVDIRDFGRSVLPSMGNSSIENLACIRQKPTWSEAKNEMMVTLLVNKESLKKFAKIEEQVPAGYTALAVEKKDGVFTFKDNKAKFLWMNLPADPYFTVSYKLIPMKAGNNKQLAIKGVFSFINVDKTQSLTIQEQEVNLANLTPELVQSIVKHQVINPVLVAQNTTPSQNSTEQASEGGVKNEKAPVVIAENKAKPEVKQETVSEKNTGKTTEEKNVTPDKSNSVVAQNKNNPVKTDVADLLEPQAGVYFRVQIAAGHKPVNTKSYFRKFQLDTLVVKEKHDGWIKYSVGLFNVYKVARDYRVHLWNTTSISDAFVAAYNDGKRITVQEALMIGNQRWYQ